MNYNNISGYCSSVRVIKTTVYVDPAVWTNKQLNSLPQELNILFKGVNKKLRNLYEGGYVVKYNSQVKYIHRGCTRGMTGSSGINKQYHKFASLYKNHQRYVPYLS